MCSGCKAMSALRIQPLLSALPAGVLSFALPKESSQRKGNPWLGSPSGFLPLLGRPGDSHELAFGSDNANRLLPARLRCSAPLKGAKKAVRYGQPEKTAKFEISNWVAAAFGFSTPRGKRRATQGLAEQGRGLSEGRSPEFRSPRQDRVAQGTGRSPAPTPGRLFFANFLLATQKKVRSRVRRENQP